MKTVKFSLSVLSFFLASCALDDEQVGLQIFTYVYDFNESTQGWETGFCDYPANSYDSIPFELQASHSPVPLQSSIPRKALKLSGNNVNNDLFMYIKRNIRNLQPNTFYTITYEIELASNANEFGEINGTSPGKNVFLKVGATAEEPKSVIEGGKYIMNIDKGNNGEDGADMVVIGDVSIPAKTSGYQLLSRSNSPTSGQAYNKPLVVKTNNRGELWLIVGTDSNYEGPTTLYYTTVTAVLSRSNYQ